MLNRGRRPWLAPRSLLRGHTLSELLIASAIGIFILGGLLHTHALHTGEARSLLAEARLHRALAEAAALITGELRRAGYWSRAREILNGASNGYTDIRIIDEDCILYSYEREANSSDGVPGNDERFGLRLRGGALQMKSSDSCGAGGCADCEGGVWWAMADPASITVSGLAFALETHQRSLPDGRTVTARSVRYALTAALTEEPGLSATLAGAADVRNDEIN